MLLRGMQSRRPHIVKVMRGYSAWASLSISGQFEHLAALRTWHPALHIGKYAPPALLNSRRDEAHRIVKC